MRFVKPLVHPGCALCQAGEWGEHHEPRRVFRVWFEGREWGIDYRVPSEAHAARLRFGALWGIGRYTVRDSFGRFA